MQTDAVTMGQKASQVILTTFDLSFCTARLTKLIVMGESFTARKLS